MKKVFDLAIAQHQCDYYNPNSRAVYHDTDTNEIVFLNCRETFKRSFHSETVFSDGPLYSIVSIHRFDRMFIK